MQVQFHVHAMEFYPEGPNEFYNDLVFTFHQINGGENLPFDPNSVLDRLFSGQFSLNVRTATIGHLQSHTSFERDAWPQPQPQSVLPYHEFKEETDGSASAAQPGSMSRPLFNGAEMRLPSDCTSPIPATTVSQTEGQRNKTGLSSANEPEVQGTSPSKNTESPGSAVNTAGNNKGDTYPNLL